MPTAFIAPTLKGTPNFRDLGGLISIDNKKIKAGLLARTEGPLYLTETDTQALRNYSFQLVCDLRSDNERESAPNHWCKDTDVELLNFSTSADLRAKGNDGWEALRGNATEEGAFRAMKHNYRSMPWVMAPHLRIMFNKIIDQDQLPVLIHCTAGKDRTGFVVALILFALNMSKETVYKDYFLTRDFLDDRFSASVNEAFLATFGYSTTPEILTAIIDIHAEYLDSAFESVNEEAGSLENYLVNNLGLTPERRLALQEKLLEPC